MKKLLFVSLIFLIGCTSIGPGQKGVRITQGKLSGEVLDSGWYIWIPFVTKVKSVSVRVQRSDDTTEAASKDLQKVTAHIVLNWHVDPVTVPKMLQNIGDEDAVNTNIINPAVSEIMKAAMAKMTAEEILTKRIDLKKDIDAQLVARLKNYEVLVDDVSIVNLNFTEQFDHAVEAKQIAEQTSKKAEYDAQRAAKEAVAEVNRAKGQAEAQRLLQTSLTPAMLQKLALDKWDGHFPQVMGQETLPFLNIGGK